MAGLIWPLIICCASALISLCSDAGTLLANGGAVLAPYHFFTGKIPAKLQTELAAVKAAIISGQIVPATKSPV